MIFFEPWCEAGIIQYAIQVLSINWKVKRWFLKCNVWVNLRFSASWTAMKAGSYWSKPETAKMRWRYCGGKNGSIRFLIQQNIRLGSRKYKNFS